MTTQEDTVPPPELETTPLDPSSRSGLILSVLRGRYSTIGVCIALGILGGIAEGVVPIGIGYALDTALGRTDHTMAAVGTAVAAVIVVAIFCSVTRFHLSERTRIAVAYRLNQAIGRRAAEAGPALPAQVPSGEVATTVSDDTAAVGALPNAIAQFAGAVIASLLVSVYLLTRSLPLGLVVLIGVPILVLVTAKAFAPLEARQREHRELLGRLTVVGADIARGLRVLRGIGGAPVLRERFDRLSGEVRRAGGRVAGVQAVLAAANVALPGIFLVAVIWIGARLAAEGHLRPGELVAFYGCAAYLVNPVSTVSGLVARLSEATVGAANVARILRTEASGAFDGTVSGPAKPTMLADPVSGVTVGADEFLAVVAAEPGEGESVAERLTAAAGPDDGSATMGGTPLHRMTRTEVRRRILLHDAAPYLFSGRLRDELDPYGEHDDGRLFDALRAACATDVVTQLDDGLETVLGEDGHQLSGGQRQRIMLARALLRAPEVLVLVDPTSAVDASTEVEIAHRLRENRRGRATVVVATGPALLAVADRVVYLTDEVHSGRHTELLDRVPAYRARTMRGDT